MLHLVCSQMSQLGVSVDVASGVFTDVATGVSVDVASGVFTDVTIGASVRYCI